MHAAATVFTVVDRDLEAQPSYRLGVGGGLQWFAGSAEWAVL